MGSSENLTELELEEEDQDEYSIKQRGETEKLLQRHLQELLSPCSRQKLRAIQMSLKTQSNVDSRLSGKDLIAVLQTHDISIDAITLQMLAEKCKDTRGNIEYQKLWRVLSNAHSNTGRESVQAKLKVNKLRTSSRQGELKRKSSALNLLMRLRLQMRSKKKETTQVLRGKIQRLKDACHAMDVDEKGRLERNQLIQLVRQQKLEIDDKLLNDLVDRCSGEGRRHSQADPEPPSAASSGASWLEMVALLEKANEQTLRRSASSESLTSSSPSNNTSPIHTYSNRSPKFSTTAKQNYTGAVSQRPVQRFAQWKAPPGSTSSSSSTVASTEVRKDTRRRIVLPPMARTGVRSHAINYRSNNRPTAAKPPSVRFVSLKSDGISPNAKVDVTVSQDTARRGRTTNSQVYSKGRTFFQTTTKQGGTLSQFSTKQGGIYARIAAVKGSAESSDSSAKRSIRDDKMTSFVEKSKNGAPQSDSSKTASTTYFRKVENSISRVKPVKLRFHIPQSNSASTLTGVDSKVSAYSSSHLGRLVEKRTDHETVSTSRIVPGRVGGTKTPPRNPLETDDPATSMSSASLDLAQERDPNEEEHLLLESLDYADDEEVEKSSVEPTESMEFPYESSAERNRLESSVEDEEYGSASEHQMESVDVNGFEEPDVEDGERSGFFQLNDLDGNLDREISQCHGQYEEQDSTIGYIDNADYCMKFASKGRTLLLPIPDKYRGTKRIEGPLKKKLDLKWVYGYSHDGGSGDLVCLKATGELVYSSGNFVVIYDRGRHSQRHYLEHTSHVTSLAVHSDGVTMASGQGPSQNQENTKAKGHVRIWSSVSLRTDWILGLGVIRHSIQAISFSNEQNMICCLEAGKTQRILIWSMRTKELIAETMSKVDITTRITFSPTSNEMLIVGGKEHLGWWKFSKSDTAIFVHQQATVDGITWPPTNGCVTSISFTERGDVVTGDSSGDVHVWNSRQCKPLNTIVKAHEGPVASILMMRNSTLVTSGEDGFIRGWRWNRTQPMEQIGELKIEEGKVCQMAASDDVIYISTSNNSILAAVLAPRTLRNPLMGVSLGKVPVTQGHSETISKICVPRRSRMGDLMISVSCDGTVCVFDYQKRIPVYKYHLKNKEIISLDVNDSATLLAIATTDTIRVHEIRKPETGVVHFRKISEPIFSGKRLKLVKICPDGETMAVVDVLGHLYVLGIVEQSSGNPRWDVVADWQASDAGDSIESFDWSASSDDVTYHIRTMSRNMRQAVWNCVRGERIDDMEFIAKLQWASYACKISYETSGVWTSGAIGAGKSVICSLDVHDGQSLTTAGQLTGHISLFRLPCVQGKQTDYVRLKGHSDAVNDVAFLTDGSQIVSVGGGTIAQWRLLTVR